MLAAELGGDIGEVLSVEASPTIFELLRDNLLRNPRLNPRVRAVNVVAAEHFGTLRFFDALGGNLGTSSTVAPTDIHGAGVEVQAVSISELIADPGRVQLVKVDVEGDELTCLRGLQPTLREMPPGASVLVEITPWSLAERGQKPDEVYRLLRDCGSSRVGRCRTTMTPSVTPSGGTGPRPGGPLQFPSAPISPSSRARVVLSPSSGGALGNPHVTRHSGASFRLD